MGTPRAGWGRHGPFGGARRRRRVFANIVKGLIVLCLCYLGVKQVLYLVRHGNNISMSFSSDEGGLDESDSFLSGISLSTSPTAGPADGLMDGDAEDYEDEDLHEQFKHIIGRHGVLSEEQQEKLQLLADVLLAEHGNVDISLFPAKSTVSGVFAHPTAGITGETTNHFYRFTNV